MTHPVPQDTAAEGRNRQIDQLKGLGAAFVVLIHAPPLVHSSVASLAWIGWSIQMLCLVAVPFFFMASGYHLAKRWSSEATPKAPVRQSLRLGMLYIPWFALYAVGDALYGRPWEPIAVLRRFLSFSDGDIPTGAFHLWFLPSLIYAQWCLWASFRFAKGPMPALLSGLALYASLGVLQAAGIALPWGLRSHEGLGLAMLGMASGALLPKIPLERWPTRTALLGALALLPLEGWLWRAFAGENIPAIMVARYLLPAALLVAALKGEFKVPAPFARLLDALGAESTGIYVLHLGFLVFLPWTTLVPNGFLRDNLVAWSTALALSWACSRMLRSSSTTRWLVR